MFCNDSLLNKCRITHDLRNIAGPDSRCMTAVTLALARVLLWSLYGVGAISFRGRRVNAVENQTNLGMSAGYNSVGVESIDPHQWGSSHVLTHKDMESKWNMMGTWRTWIFRCGSKMDFLGSYWWQSPFQNPFHCHYCGWFPLSYWFYYHILLSIYHLGCNNSPFGVHKAGLCPYIDGEAVSQSWLAPRSPRVCRVSTIKCW